MRPTSATRRRRRWTTSIAKQINPTAARRRWCCRSARPAPAIKEILSFSAPGTAFPATVNPVTVYNQLTGVFGTGPGHDRRGRLAGQARAERPRSAARPTWRGTRRSKMSKTDQGAGQELDGPAADHGDRQRMRCRPTTATSCSKMTAEAAPFNRAPSANVTAASPTGKITLGSVLGNTPDPVGDKNLATSFTLGGDMMHEPDRADDDLRHEPHDHDAVSRLRDVQLGRHHAHARAPRPVAPHRATSPSAAPAASTGVLDMIAQIDKWYAGKYAKLVGLLDSISEGNGTLLDNTATMWLPELSDGAAHNLNNLPIVIAGQRGRLPEDGSGRQRRGTGTPADGQQRQLLRERRQHRQHRLERRQRADQQAVRDADERGRLHRTTDGSKVTPVRSIRRHGLDGRHHQPRRGHQADVGWLAGARARRALARGLIQSPARADATRSAASGGAGCSLWGPLLKWPLRGHRRS